jgi:hypothetical protein
VLQRRWAEVEQEGIAALEKAHEHAESILRDARTQAGALAAAEPVPVDPGQTPGTTAQEAITRLDLALAAARDVVARRAVADEDETGIDNDTNVSGVWSQIVDDTLTTVGERPATFQVPKNPAPTDESVS